MLKVLTPSEEHPQLDMYEVFYACPNHIFIVDELIVFYRKDSDIRVEGNGNTHVLTEGRILLYSGFLEWLML